MPLVKLNYPELCALIGKKIPREKLLETIPMLGADVERVEGEDWGVEFFPNRPDLYSPEGVARALRAFLQIRPGLKEYRVRKSDWVLRADKSVARVRPVIVCALVDNVRMNHRRVQTIMDLQEDLHWGVGARRRRVSIGVHDRAALSPPLDYRAVSPDGFSFVPLGSDKEMTLREILEAHPKGVRFAHLLAGHAKWPVITDAKDQVLSFPPIINGIVTTVTEKTSDIFVDVTGTDERACRAALNIVASHLAEQGGILRAIRVRSGTRVRTSPDLSPQPWTVSPSRAAELLGLELSPRKIAACLSRMGYDARPSRRGIRVLAPAYRNDLLHEADLIEDIAVGYGYWRIREERPRQVTYGEPLAIARVAEAAREVMLGLGYFEVMTLSLSNDRDQFERLGILREHVVLHNPITEEHTNVRVSLLPSLLAILEKNAHRDLPQQIFEIADVVLPQEERMPANVPSLACARIAAKASFTEAKGIAQALLRDLGLPAEIAAGEHGAFVPGRCAVFRSKKEEIGVFGEVHPRTLTAFGLQNPVVALEMRLPGPSRSER